MQPRCTFSPHERTAELSPAQRKIYSRGVLPSRLERLTGLNKSTISRTLRGLSRHADAQRRIAEAVGMTPRELFGRMLADALRDEGDRHAA